MFRISKIAATLLGVMISAGVAEGEERSLVTDYLTLSEMEVRELEADPYLQPMSHLPSDDCQPPAPQSDLGGQLPDLNSVIAIGEKLWKLVESSRPVVAFKAPIVHALPASTICWTELESWQPPRSSVTEVVYRNKLGVTVVRFRYRVSFTAGGTNRGIGRYLANASVQPVKIDVAWGFTFNSETVVGRAINLGTNADPLAALQLMVTWNVKSVLKESASSENFFIQGDGVIRHF